MVREGGDWVTAEVDAVVVSYNVSDLVLRCISALRADGIARVVVVDSASSDGSAATVRREEPDVDLVALSTNVGFGAAVNRAVGRTSSPYVLIVNPDVVVEPGSTKALVEVLESQPDVAIAAPRVETTDGRLYESARRFPTLSDALGHAFLYFVWPTNPFSRRYRMTDWDHGPADVDWVAGTHLLVRRSAWDAIGGFDERFFMYMEDVDLCRSLGRAGWRIRYEPAARVIHGIGRSTDQTPYRMIRIHHVSMYRYAEKTWEGPRRALLPLVAGALTLRTGLAWLQRILRGRPHAAP
jgi:N-acetylglucosaminyl-diphospho-decaprenol L-rhamnosyltransferase